MAVEDSFERARLWRKIGEIYREQLKDPYQAIEAFQSVVDVGAGARDTTHALDAIVRLNAELERWTEVEEGLRRLLALADNDETRATLLGRAAEVVGDKLGRYPDAIDLLEQVLKISPAGPSNASWPSSPAPAPSSASTSSRTSRTTCAK